MIGRGFGISMLCCLNSPCPAFWEADVCSITTRRDTIEHCGGFRRRPRSRRAPEATGAGRADKGHAEARRSRANDASLERHALARDRKHLHRNELDNGCWIEDRRRGRRRLRRRLAGREEERNNYKREASPASVHSDHAKRRSTIDTYVGGSRLWLYEQ